MVKQTIVFDANILIDLVKVEKELLHLLSKEFNLVVPDLILSEVDGLNESAAEENGLMLMETPLELIEISQKKLKGCSFQDTVCFQIARANKWICATNDKKLGRECRKAQVKVVRSFRLLIMLIERKAISRTRAITIAIRMTEINPQLTAEVLKDFIREVEKKTPEGRDHGAE
ncbi:MAG: hypothetical protein ACLFSE_11065 [Spirochaetia bacterium]